MLRALALLLLLLCLPPACRAPAAPNAFESNLAGEAGCGGPSDEDSGNATCADFELSAADIQRYEALAARGDVSAMRRLASHHIAGGDVPAGRRWYAQAATRGDCEAVRWLNAAELNEATSAAERDRWAAEDRRRGCRVERWETAADGGVVYAQPASHFWQMRIDCVGGTPEVSGPSALTPSDSSQITYRTSRGPQTRRTRDVRHDFVARAFPAAPGDEVLAALLRGERIEAGFGTDGTGWTIDGRGAAAHLQPLLARCGD